MLYGLLRFGICGVGFLLVLGVSFCESFNFYELGSAHVCLLMFVIFILEQLGFLFLFWYVFDLLPVMDELLIAVKDVFNICLLYCFV